MSNNSQLLQNLGQKLGLTSSSVLRKAEELQRLLATRGVRGLSNSAEAVICLQLAASVSGETCDKGACAKLAGLTAPRYRSQVQAVAQLLGLSQRLSIHDLAVAHSVLSGEQLAVDALKHYASQSFGNLDIEQPLYQAAGLAAACSLLSIKVDKKKLIDASGATKPVFDKLLLKLREAAEHVTEKQKQPLVTDTKNKRTKTLMDLIEDNLTESNGTQQPAGDSVAGRPPKTDEDQEDQDYEQWKKQMLEQAGQQ